MTPTPTGRRFAGELAESPNWTEIHDRSRAIAEASANMTGNALKDRIYERLAGLMDRPLRRVIR